MYFFFFLTSHFSVFIILHPHPDCHHSSNKTQNIAESLSHLFRSGAGFINFFNITICLEPDLTENGLEIVFHVVHSPSSLLPRADFGLLHECSQLAAVLYHSRPVHRPSCPSPIQSISVVLGLPLGRFNWGT